MQCNPESLQMYLDGELDAASRQTLKLHLGQCRYCRQEMARLQLLWLELEINEEAALPLELPYLRQQIISQALRGRQAETGYWEMQKLAWQPAIMGASYLPGLELLAAASRAAGQQLPRIGTGVLNMARKLIFPARDKKGGSSP